MHLISLSDSGRFPCYLLQLEDLNILLDCSLDKNSILEYNNGFYLKFPDFDAIDISLIDVVLITNFDNIYALPFLTNSNNFKAKIYLTQPTFTFAKLYLEELVKLCDFEHRCVHQNYFCSKTNISLKYPYRKIYSLQDVENSLNECSIVAYNEKNNFECVTFWPIETGFSLGSCSWMIEIVDKKIFYMGATTTEFFNLEPFDSSILKNLDFVIMGFQLNPLSNFKDNLASFIKKYNDSLTLNNVIFLPNIPNSLFYQIVNNIYLTYQTSLMMKPVVNIVSPFSKLLIKYSNFFIDYFNKVTKNAACEILPPFLLSDMVNNQRLILACDWSELDLKDNSFMIFNHINCYQGNFMHCVKLLKEYENYHVILTDYGSKVETQLKVIEEAGLQEQCTYIPLSHSLSNFEFKMLMADKNVKNIIGVESIHEIKGSKFHLLGQLESFEDKQPLIYREVIIEPYLADEISPALDYDTPLPFTTEMDSNAQRLSFSYPASFIHKFDNPKSFEFDIEKFKSESINFIPSSNYIESDSKVVLKINNNIFVSITRQEKNIKVELAQNIDDSLRKSLFNLIESCFV